MQATRGDVLLRRLTFVDEVWCCGAETPGKPALRRHPTSTGLSRQPLCRRTYHGVLNGPNVSTGIKRLIVNDLTNGNTRQSRKRCVNTGNPLSKPAFLQNHTFGGSFDCPPVALKSLLRLTFFSLKPVAVDLFSGHIATLSTSPSAGYSNKRRELDPLRRFGRLSGRFLAQLRTPSFHLKKLRM